MNFKQEPVKVTIGDREFELFYDLNAYAEIENRHGNIDKAMEELGKGSLKALRLILWAGLIHKGTTYNDLTGEATAYPIKLHEVGSLINAGNMHEISESISKAIAAGMPEAEESNTKNEVTA